MASQAPASVSVSVTATIRAVMASRINDLSGP
jgi:hypothetical protein